MKLFPGLMYLERVCLKHGQLSRKHEFSDREIVRLFTVLDEDRNSFLDENEIIQWAEDIGLKWSRVEVTLTKYYKLIINKLCSSSS